MMATGALPAILGVFAASFNACFLCQSIFGICSPHTFSSHCVPSFSRLWQYPAIVSSQLVGVSPTKGLLAYGLGYIGHPRQFISGSG